MTRPASGKIAVEHVVETGRLCLSKDSTVQSSFEICKMLIRFKLEITFSLRPCHTIAYRTSVCQRMENITHTPVYAGIL
jgi:hypothetical protein